MMATRSSMGHRMTIISSQTDGEFRDTTKVRFTYDVRGNEILGGGRNASATADDRTCLFRTLIAQIHYRTGGVSESALPYYC